jgi:hypothetical protein
MRKQLKLVSGVLTLSALLAVGAAAYAGPDKGDHGAPGERGKGPGNNPGADDKGKDKDRDEAKGEKAGDKDKDDKDGDKDHRHGHHMGPHAMHELLDELGSGKLKKGDVKDRLEDLRKGRAERAKEHREELKNRFGSLLAQPAVREELENHGRRMARLDRAMLLCETEVKKDKDKLKERISKLITRENERHDKAMERFKSAPTPPSASAAAPTASAAPAKAGE